MKLASWLLAPLKACFKILFIPSSRSCGKGFREAVKFYLPKLLLGPIYHCREYFNYIKILRKLTNSDEEKEILDQVRFLAHNDLRMTS